MARSLKEGEVNELKSRISIQDIISNYVNLKKTGKSYVGHSIKKKLPHLQWIQ